MRNPSEVDLTEARYNVRSKKPTHTYLYRWYDLPLEVKRVPCIIESESKNYFWITYKNPEFHRWSEACVGKSTSYVEPMNK